MVWATNGAPAPAYRVAVATTGDVQQIVTVTGTTTVLQQKSVGFPTSGSVSSVSVQIGEKVTAG
ncbi:MAG: hypothetical protein QOI26_1950, partial [Pseudonocardiales bacterium]|nr:hypothetical protein [Pseudonocardiales bacterium]